LVRSTPLPYGRQSISQEDLYAVIDVLQGDWLTQGPNIADFEARLAIYCGAKYAVAFSSGTAALHLANLVLQVQPNSKVLTTPISFVATTNSIIYAGGIPSFCDIDSHTFNIDPVAVKRALDLDPDIVGIIPVHLGGLVADVEAIFNISRKTGQWIIEDACHALGGSWIDSSDVERRVGDCTFSDMTIFSFHPVKHVTTGEGGAITTNNEAYYKLLLELRSHGITRDSSRLREQHGGWYYEMQRLGFNYRLTDIQAALGAKQLERSDVWAKRRRELVARYDLELKSIAQLTPQHHSEYQKPSYHLYIVRVKERKRLYDYLRKQNIFTQVHYIPIHMQPFYQDHYGTSQGQYPEAEAYYEEALSLPLFPKMSDEDQQDVIEAVRAFYG
jgi:UDP-4-amino-4,6-dideoxy-N-acetyl-beta-L-altrosamine transaminase